MKRFVFSLLALAALAAVPSCMKEPVSSPDPALGGTPVEVTFQVDLDNVLTKADNTTLDNASGTWNLYVAAFSTADGSLISTSKIGGTGYEPVETLSGSTQKNITLTLSKGASYKVVFFAEKAGAYDVSFADKNVAKFSYNTGLLANSAGLDAFFATVDVSSSTTVYSVTLKRPFAQVNVLVPLTAVPTGQTAFSSAMKVKAPTTFDLFAGAATGDASVVEFINSTITASPWGKYADTHKWVGMNYVLVPSDGQVEVTYFKESGMPVAIAPGKVPAKMNGRTNLVGNIYDLSTDFNFTVQIGIGFDSEKEEPVIAEETEITFADNSTYTTQNPLIIDASAATKPQNVTLRVNGHTFAEVLAGAAQGATITATSANPAIAKAAVSGNEVVITPVGDGQTVITVTTPAYTKADYRGASFEIPVKVEGMSGGGGGQGGGGSQGSGNLPYSVDFTKGQGDFTTDNAVVTGSSTKVWTQSSSYGMVATAYVKLDGADAKSDNAAVSWMYSPVIDLAGATAPTVSFDHAVNYFKDVETAKTQAEAYVKVEGGEWTKMDIAYPDKLSFTYISSGEISLSAYVGKKVQFGFKYTSTAEKAGTWEIKNFLVDDTSQPIETTISFAKETLEVTVGSTGTNAITTNNTAGAKTFSTSNASIASVDPSTGVVTGAAVGTATITVSIAASGRYTANSASYTVSVKQADTSGSTAKLTNAEILTAVHDASVTGQYATYGDVTITSTSGTWTGNVARHPTAVNYIQLRNQQAAQLTSPVFSSNIDKVVFTMTDDDGVSSLSDRTLHAVPANTTLPTAKDEKYSATVWANQYGSVKTGTTKGAQVTMSFTGDTKQFMLVVEGGATFIKDITVYFK